MSAISEHNRSNRTSSSRLPLTPKVMSNRRGSHVPNRSGQAPSAAPRAATTPAMHITPNVVAVTRGDVGTSFSTAFSDASRSGALNMRNLRL